jgi:predicted nucleotidyltransferase
MNSPEIYGLPTHTVASIKNVLGKYPLDEVLIYGSRAMGTFKNGSDIDLVIKAPGLSTTDLFKIEAELDDLMLPYEIDLSLFHHIQNNDLKTHIERVGISFWSALD